MASLENQRKNSMIAARCYIPLQNPWKPRGENAHFITEQVIGVADGVSGWAKRGVDAGIYARKLMKHTKAAARGLGPLYADPKEVLEQAYRKTAVLGSSTACIVSYDGGQTLRSANVGDSGFMVLRGGVTLFKSPVQQSGFNLPYQLAWTGATVLKEVDEFTVEGVEDGDVVVVGSDGLFDNLFEEDIESVVETCLEKGKSPKETAETLAEKALAMSLDKTGSSPFGVAAREAGLRHSGGNV